MAQFVDEAIFLERGGNLLQTPLASFQRQFRCYRVLRNGNNHGPAGQWEGNTGNIIKNIETHANHWDVFSFAEKDRVLRTFREQNWNVDALEEVPMNLEDAFIGYTGRY